ncbi:MAG: hypothetical protein WA890_01035 [Micromonospora sp.]
MAVTARSSRPHGIWYAIAALIAAGGVLAAGAVLFLVPFGGDLGQAITPGQPVTVQLPEAGKMVWVKDGGGALPDLHCESSDVDTRRLEEWREVSMRGDQLTLTADGERWRALLLVSAKPTGQYTLTCAPSGPALSIGDPPRFHGPRANAIATLAAVVLASLGVLVGAALTLVVAVRRR